MIPGLGSNVINKDNEKESIKRIKKFLCMFDSMTDSELDSVKPLIPSRMFRIAQGSGTSVEEV
jgi:signal recognition particle subunit SRP54